MSYYTHALLTVCFSTNQKAITLLHCWQSVLQPIRELLHFLHCCLANQWAITLFALFTCTRKTQFGIYCTVVNGLWYSHMINLIMRKVAALIIFEWIQFSGRARSSRHREAFLAKQNGKVTGRTSLLVHQDAFLSNNTCEVSAEAL